MKFKTPIIRLVSIMAGAGVLFGLQQGLGLALYFAIPIAVIAYTACRLGLGLLAPETPAG